MSSEFSGAIQQLLHACRFTSNQLEYKDHSSSDCTIFYAKTFLIYYYYRAYVA